MEKSPLPTFTEMAYSSGMDNYKRMTLLIMAIFFLPLLFVGRAVEAKYAPPEIGPKVPVAPRPSGLTWDGSSVWVIGNEGEYIQRVDPDTGEILYSFTGGSRLQDILFANDYIWVTERSEDQLLQIDPQTNQRRGLSAAGSPRSLAYDAASSSIWVNCNEYGLLRRYDAVSGESRAGITEGVLKQARLTAWGAESLWLAAGQDLQRIDPVSGDTEVYTLPGYPYDMVWGGSYLWLTTSLANRLVRVDADGEMTQYLVGVRPFAMAWDGKSLWVSDYTEESLLQVNPDNGEVLSTIELGYRPHAITWADDRLWVADIWGDSIQYVQP